MSKILEIRKCFFHQKIKNGTRNFSFLLKSEIFSPNCKEGGISLPMPIEVNCTESMVPSIFDAETSEDLDRALAQCDVNEKDAWGRTCLHIAYIRDPAWVLALLCRASCDVNALTRDDDIHPRASPLIMATSHGSVDVARHLLEVRSTNSHSTALCRFSPYPPCSTVQTFN